MHPFLWNRLHFVRVSEDQAPVHDIPVPQNGLRPLPCFLLRWCSREQQWPIYFRFDWFHKHAAYSRLYFSSRHPLYHAPSFHYRNPSMPVLLWDPPLHFRIQRFYHYVRQSPVYRNNYRQIQDRPIPESADWYQFRLLPLFSFSYHHSIYFYNQTLLL